MRGFAFALLERALVARDGTDAWDDLLDTAGWDGPAELTRDYDDLAFTRLLHVASGAVDEPTQWRWFGEHATPHLRPFEVARPARVESEVPRLVDERYRRLEMLCTGQAAPVLTWRLDRSHPGVLAVSRRPAGLPCWALEGLATSVASGRAAETVRVFQPKCSAHGARGCLVVLDLRPAARVGG